MRKPIPGYSFFECCECGNHWKSKTRDCTSPSIETCYNCDEHEGDFPIDLMPYTREIDLNLETDEYGNLK